MPQTRECDYCGDDIEPGTGTMYVRTDGSVTHFCSSKCERNADLGRESRDQEWTAAGQDAAPDQPQSSPTEDEPTITEPATEEASDETPTESPAENQ